MELAVCLFLFIIETRCMYAYMCDDNFGMTLFCAAAAIIFGYNTFKHLNTFIINAVSEGFKKNFVVERIGDNDDDS